MSSSQGSSSFIEMGSSKASPPPLLPSLSLSADAMSGFVMSRIVGEFHERFFVAFYEGGVLEEELC